MPVCSAAAPVVLSDTPQIMPARRARRLVRRAAYVAVYVTLTEHGTADLMDCSKASVLCMLARVDRCWLSEVFGSIFIGRPEPLAKPCSRCDPEDLADIAA
jgi:hypothetical protein